MRTVLKLKLAHTTRPWAGLQPDPGADHDVGVGGHIVPDRLGLK